MMRKLALLAVALAASSCLPFLEPDDEWIERPSVLATDENPENVAAPGSARRGTAFNVTFTTYGGGCEPTRNAVIALGLEVHIISTDRERRDRFCPDVYRVVSHVVPVTVRVIGTATVQVHGQAHGDDLVVTRSVTIEP